MLKNFYKTVNPWGWWGPIRDKVMEEDPTFEPNYNAVHDLTNVVVGIVWQLCLVRCRFTSCCANGTGSAPFSWCFVIYDGLHEIQVV